MTVRTTWGSLATMGSQDPLRYSTGWIQVEAQESVFLAEPQGFHNQEAWGQLRFDHTASQEKKQVDEVRSERGLRADRQGHKQREP